MSPFGCGTGNAPPRRSVWELVKEEIDGGIAVPDDYEIGSA
jgi:hypothetical protein